MNNYLHNECHFLFRTEGSSNECCYDSSGQLIVGPTSGGSVDKVSYIRSDPSKYMNRLLSHQQEDILPYIYCCKGPVTVCDVYYKRRPSDNGTAYVPPIPGECAMVNTIYGMHNKFSLDYW